MTDPAPQGQAWVNTDGSFGTLDSAPDTIRDLVSKKGWKGVGDLASAYTELEKFKGVSPDKLFTVPEAGDVDGWSKVYNKLGRPETPDKYTTKFKAPEGIEIQQELLDNFKKYAHEKGMSDALFNDVVQFQLDASAEMQKIFQQQSEEAQKAQEEQLKVQRIEAEKALKEKYKWTKDDEYQQGILEARKLADKLNIYQTLEKKGLADDPEVISMLVDISKNISESALPKSNPTPKETKSEALSRIYNNPALNDKMHPDHEKVVRELHEVSRRQS
jgi:hypothetical protein